MFDGEWDTALIVTTSSASTEAHVTDDPSRQLQQLADRHNGFGGMHPGLLTK